MMWRSLLASAVLAFLPLMAHGQVMRQGVPPVFIEVVPPTGWLDEPSLGHDGLWNSYNREARWFALERDRIKDTYRQQYANSAGQQIWLEIALRQAEDLRYQRRQLERERLRLAAERRRLEDLNRLRYSPWVYGSPYYRW